VTHRNRRTWDVREKGEYGFDGDVQDFTLTYSETLESGIEGLMIKICLNGFMCGYPTCCVINYAKRWFKWTKTHQARDVESHKFGVTENGQRYAQCRGIIHE
jgi:hypothetical protein